MDQAKIPTLKDSKKPQVKLRGLGSGLTLFDRFKQFKKKDLAFILAGLGTLFMAPMAEHFMMSPESADGTLQQGWGGHGAGAGGANTGGIFGGGNGPYEPGTTGLAPGGAIGGGSDVITPLNVRDPSALVMGPGATQQPPTNSVAPATPPPTAPATHSNSDLKDALAASARGIGAAAQKALLPVPKISLGGSGLHGLSAVSGGSSAAASLGPISSQGLVGDKAAQVGGLTNVRPTSSFKGVARGPGSGGGGAIEGLAAAAAKQAGNFGRTGSAATDLNAAASQAIPDGKGNGFGGVGQGGIAKNDKGPGGDNNKDSKNTGESLAFLKQKMMMEKQMALDFKKKEANDWGLQTAQWRNDFIKSMISGPLTDIAGGTLKNMWKGGDPVAYRCYENGTSHNVKLEIHNSELGSAVDTTKPGSTGSYVVGETDPTTGATIIQGGNMTYHYCWATSDAPSKPTTPPQQKLVGGTAGRLTGEECQALSGMTSSTVQNGAKAVNTGTQDAFLKAQKDRMRAVSSDLANLSGQGTVGCGDVVPGKQSDNVVYWQGTATDNMSTALNYLQGNQNAGAPSDMTTAAAQKTLADVRSKLKIASDALAQADGRLSDASGINDLATGPSLNGLDAKSYGPVAQKADASQKNVAGIYQNRTKKQADLKQVLSDLQATVGASDGDQNASIVAVNKVNDEFFDPTKASGQQGGQAGALVQGVDKANANLKKLGIDPLTLPDIPATKATPGTAPAAVLNEAQSATGENSADGTAKKKLDQLAQETDKTKAQAEATSVQGDLKSAVSTAAEVRGAQLGSIQDIAGRLAKTGDQNQHK